MIKSLQILSFMLTSSKYLRQKECKHGNLNSVDERGRKDHNKMCVSKQGFVSQIWVDFSRTQLNCANYGDEQAQNKIDNHRSQHPSQPIDVGSHANQTEIVLHFRLLLSNQIANVDYHSEHERDRDDKRRKEFENGF